MARSVLKMPTNMPEDGQLSCVVLFVKEALLTNELDWVTSWF